MHGNRRLISMVLAVVMALMCVGAGAATDGGYTGVAKGFGGDIEVTIEVAGDKLTDVTATGAGETAGIGADALEALCAQALSGAVDGVSGATVTSDAFRLALNDCLTQAGLVGAASAQPAKDGTYEGKAFGFMSEIVVNVTMKSGAIERIDVASIGDTGLIGGAAAAELSNTIVETQSLGVDVVAGATVSSNGFIAAVANAIENAGADAGAYRKVSVPKRAATEQSLTADVLVIGAGAAGLSAAIEAAQAGADVLVIEKEGVFGGSTTRSEGFIMGAGTAYQKAHGTLDTVEAMYEDMLELYADEPALNTALLKKAVYDSGDVVDWLEQNGVEYVHLETISPIAPRDIPRAHVSYDMGNGMVERMVEAAKASGARILLNTPAIQIVKENGVVVGAKATNQFGDDIAITAKSTILCAGSYGGNVDMMNELTDMVPVFYSGSGDGDGWTLAEDAGAKMIKVGFAAGSYMYFPYGYWDGSATLPGSPTKAYFDTIQVNASGVRLVNEDAFTFDFGDPLFDSGDAYGWSVVGKAFTDEYPELYEAGVGKTFVFDGTEQAITATADTVEELAALTGMDAETLAATIERYNAACDAGVDEEFGKDAQYLTRVDAPYTAYLLGMVISDGYSGCAINENAQVLDLDGTPIDGFYAAGACALSQMIGNRYFGCGSLIMTSCVYGRAAAMHAVGTLS